MKLIQRLLLFGCVSAMLCSLGVHIALCQTPDVVPNRVTQAVDDTVRVTLKGNVHPLARAEFSRGPVPDNLAMDRILLVLRHSDSQEAALQSLLDAQQDKSSSNYHQWLTPDKFGTQFGPSDADLQVVTDWLSAQGFASVRVGAGRNVIEFSGSAGQVKNAFGTSIQNYQVNGAMYVANASNPQIPSALAPVVAGIVSLHNFPRKSHAKYLGVARKGRNSSRLQPLLTFPDPSTGNNFYGVGPGDFAKIYNSRPLLASGTDGTGETIAIVGETQINPQDVSDFRTMFGLSNNFSASNIVLNGMDPGVTSQEEESESDLDVQWSGAVAPGATVKFVVSASTPSSAGIDLSALYIVEHNLADVMSESYGDCESDLGTAGNAFYNSLWEQAAAQGISVAVSSGDGGSAGCDDFHAQPPVPATHGIAVSGLSGTPFNVSVGGTDFNQGNVWSTYWNATNDSATGTSAKGYIPEIPWNENCAQLGLSGCGASAPQGSVNIVAGSGGPSRVYAKPKWQMGVSGMPNDNHRDQPDISLFASSGFTGSAYIYCQSDRGGTPCSLNNSGSTFYLVGGTSAAAPAFAGIMSLVNQYTAAHGGSTRQGNPNYVLYALAKKSGASCASSSTEATSCIFNDVVAGNNFLATKYGMSVGSNSVPCNGGTANCSSAAGTIGVMVDPNKTSTEAWTAAAGYDLATGLGSLNVDNLAMSWGSASAIATTTSLTLSPATGITHGTNENVAVTVNVKPNTGTGIASGDVALLAKMPDGSTLGVDQFTLLNGTVASTKTQSLPGGTYQVYAHYAGDGTNAPSDSASVQVSVAKESSQTFIVIPTFDSQGKQTSGNATSVTYGSSYIIRMYATNSSAVANASGPPSPTCENVNEITCPTGIVTLTGNGTAVDGGSFALNNNGYTRDLAPTLNGGTYSLVAKYSGDNSYTANTSAADTFVVTPVATQIQMDSYPTRVVQGQTFQLEANVTSQLGGSSVLVAYPGGTVSFYDGTTALLGPVQITHGANGQIYADIYNVSLTSPGLHTFTAKYGGDNNYAASTSSPVTSTLLITTAMSLSVTATNINFGQSINATVTMTSNSKGPAITGQIFFGTQNGTDTNASTTPGTAANGDQMLTVTDTLTPIGTESIYAFYQGDANYAPSSTLVNITITVNIPDFTVAPAAGITLIPVAGQAGSAQITISPLSQMPSTVNVSWYGITSTAIVGYTLSLSPQQVSLKGSPATATLSLTPIGTTPQTNIRRNARRAGFFLLTRSDWWRLGYVAGLAALLLFSLPGRRERRYRFAFGLGATCLLCIAIGCGGGGSSIVTPPPPPSITPTSVTLTTSNPKVDQNTQFVLTMKVTADHPLTGTVTLYDYGTALLGGIDLTNGQAQTTASFGGIFGVGVHQLTASYSGDSENLASTSASVSQAITGTFSLQIQGSTGADGHFLPATVGLQ
ncbi:MAG TPA: Ig-like domain repeat protein [Candidatus Acidoferrum sp.]